MPVHDDQHASGEGCPGVKGDEDLEEGESKKIIERE
jgi:hypothetical protein